MEQIRALFAPKPANGEHRDKLQSKKQHEKEVHAAFKQLQREKKEETKAKKDESKALLKEERMLHDTKRAHSDARHLARREEHKSTVQVCDHGVVRCRICFPHKGSGK
ncbi:hypothetical protein ABPG77_000059 [Micractinium sp. CCAP 211/92]